MKKILTIAAMSAAVLTAGAQKSVQGSRFFDNWSVGVVGGGIVKTSHTKFFKGIKPVAGVELSKQVTPILGFTGQLTAAAKVTPSANLVDATNLSLIARVNLSNAICGYKGQPRLFEVEAAIGAGWGHDYYNSSMGSDISYLTSKYGFNFNFNLGQLKAWTVSLKPAIVYNMNKNANKELGYNVNQSAIEMLAGVTYHFKNHSNGKHYMTYVKAYDQAEVDGLNAKVNDLRAQVNDKDAQIAKLAANARNLQQQLNDARNQKPNEIVKTITHSTNSLEQTVTFRQGKSTVDASQLPNVERVATFLKNHKKSTVSIKGYASPEGSAEINAKIALARAEAVKTILVNKYGIAASRISAEGQGVGNMFSESDWNRVSICTIQNAE